MYSKQQIVDMLSIDNTSPEFYQLISEANEKSRTEYKDKGYIFAQIGLNSKPCTGACKFCSLGNDFFSLKQEIEMTKDELKEKLTNLDYKNLDSVFLMTTEDYCQDKYLEMCQIARQILPQSVNLIANVGDFEEDYALKLKDAKVNGVYHIVRLREGIDTAIPKEVRINTLEAIKKVGLDLLYCIEPIGSEHTYDEIADEILRAVEYNVDVMAVMSRVPVKGTYFEDIAEISEIELTKIAAVSRLVVNPKKSMNVHEIKKMPMLAGINQLYAEIGVNPRDTVTDTSLNRGYSTQQAIEILNEFGYKA